MLIKLQAVVLLLLVTAPSIAQDYVINVHGIVCQFCSIGVTKKVAKLAFIDRSKYRNGVKVEIEQQMVTIAVKAGVALDEDALFAAIKSGGYEPKAVFTRAPDGELTPYQP